MSTRLVLSEDYTKHKLAAIETQPLRKRISLSEFNVVDNTHILIDGVVIEVTEHVFNKLLRRLQIPASFAKRFAEGFGQDGLRQLITMMRSFKTAKSDTRVTLLVNPDTRKIVDILPEKYASISTEAFFDFAENYIDQYDLGVTHVSGDMNGSQINCISNSGTFAVPGLQNEIFQTGVMFRNTPERGLEVSPYLSRLVCSNGMTSTTFQENYNLHTLSDKSIHEFNEHMIMLASSNFQPSGFADTIRKAHSIDASLAEMQQAASAILSIDKSIDYDYIQRYIPVERAVRAYRDLGADPTTFNRSQLKNAKSGMSVWDMVNGLTNFASNDQRYSVNNSKRGNLMITAGNILTKRSYDTEALLSVDPFANRQLLTAAEAASVRGDNSI